jgi:hypothetical protein
LTSATSGTEGEETEVGKGKGRRRRRERDRREGGEDERDKREIA